MSKSLLSVMSRSVLSVVAIAMGAIVLDAGSAFAKTVAVGPKDACLPAQPHYDTIQLAVDALAGFNTDNTINVCPGTYPEQVTVKGQPTLTIKGVANPDTGQALSLITSPPGGLRNNVSSSLGDVAAQVGIFDSVGVKLINLTIDGAGGKCQDEKAIGAGIAYIKIGDVSMSQYGGTMQNVVVREQKGCAASVGILSDDSYISITGSVVHDIRGTCIQQIGGDININNNTIQACSNSGIFLDGTSNATVSNNVLSNQDQYGIRLNKTTSCTVNANTLGPWVGVAIYVDNSTDTGVTSNKIKSAYMGILLERSTGSIVRLNSVHRTATYALGHSESRGNNQFTNNTVSEARYGLYTHQSLPTDLLEPNTFLNTLQTTTSTPVF